MTTLEILLSVSTGLLLVVSVILFKILNKSTKVAEAYEEIIKDQVTYIEKISYLISDSKENIDKLDEKGAFKSDDEVGRFFETLKEIQKLLNTFIVPKGYGKTEKEGG